MSKKAILSEKLNGWKELKFDISKPKQVKLRYFNDKFFISNITKNDFFRLNIG